MGERECFVDARLVRCVAIYCADPKCRSQIIFDATADRGPGHLVCPNCGVAMPSATTIATAYRAFQRAVHEAPLRARLVIADDGDA